MIKVMFFLKRKPGMSPEAFQQHWIKIHAPIVEKFPGIRKLKFCYCLPSQYINEAPVCDAVSELWFDSEEAFTKAKESHEWVLAGEDAHLFVDFDKITSIISHEEIVKP